MAWGAVASIKGPQGDQGPTGATGSAGSTGSTGSTGAAGADGKTVLSGSGAPGGGLGVDGDFYIRTSDWTIYGPKTSGAWGSPVSIVGPQGSTGSTGATGADGSAPLTTKGDILGRSSSAAVRVPVGANGTTPVADSGQSAGWSWVDERNTARTLTNARVTKRVTTASTAPSGTLTFDADNADMAEITGQSAALTIGAHSGTPTNGQPALLKVKDNGTARALTWNAVWRAGTGVVLPTTTVISKWLYAIAVWNSTDSVFDVLDVWQQA